MTQKRRETVCLTNGHDRPLLLCVEPIGEQVEMAPGQTYEVLTVGGVREGSLEIILESSKIVLYGWNNSDSAVFHESQQVAGMDVGDERK